MAILIGENSCFLIQGITGKQGSLACAKMLDSGAKVVAGVTPGKGGQEICGVMVYNSVAEVLSTISVDVSVVYVPPKLAKGAIVEAILAGIPLINIITENIPVHDMAYCFSLAKKKGVRIIGATSAGIYSVGKAKCGSIAGGEKAQLAFTSGSMGVISRSGGMCCETSLVLSQAGLGQSTVVSIGSDILMGESFVELVKEFENDDNTKGIVLFGEIGGTTEEDLAAYLIERKLSSNVFTKPIVAFISGKFAAGIRNISLGHAGAIIESGKGTRESKVRVLREAGVVVADVHHEVGKLMKEELIKRGLMDVTKVKKSIEIEIAEKKEEIKENYKEKQSEERKKFKTKISKITSEGLMIRGDSLGSLLQGRFTDAIFFLLSGRKAEEKESLLFEKMLISIIDHGMGTTSSMASRFVVSGGNALNVGVGAGMLSIGDYHGGAIEKAMKQFKQWKELGKGIKRNIIEMISNRKTIYGFGHKHYKEGDPRVALLIEEMERVGFNSEYLFLKEIVEKAFFTVKSKTIKINIDGLLALLLLDFGFDSRLGKGIFLIGRCPGLVAQCYEEMTEEKPVRRVSEEEIDYLG